MPAENTLRLKDVNSIHGTEDISKQFFGISLIGNILLVVKDIEKSRKFYHDLFGIDMVLDNDGNMILTEGLVLQDEKIWKRFLGRDIIPKSNSCELYFEEQDIESFVEKLERLYPSIEYVYFAIKVCSILSSVVSMNRVLS